MNGPVAIDPQLFNFGLLIIRLVFGLTVAAHGAQKLFGAFGGYGIAGTGGFMESLGFRPGKQPPVGPTSRGCLGRDYTELFAGTSGFSQKKKLTAKGIVFRLQEFFRFFPQALLA